MEKVKISVVTVCYNAAETIEETMLSVLNQTYDNIEYIIIDGGSSDGTVDIIKKYSDQLAYWVSEPDKGIYDAMNKGIAVATGDYINFMNAGDNFVNRDVIADIFHDTSFNNEDIIYGNIIYAYPWGKVLVKPCPLTEFESNDPIGHPSSFTKRSLLSIKPFDISFKIAGDYNFFYQSYITNKIFKYIDIAIAVFDANEGISSTSFNLRLKEGLRATGKKPDLVFYIRKTKVMSKSIIKRFVLKISPSLAGSLQKRGLLRNSRITEWKN